MKGAVFMLLLIIIFFVLQVIVKDMRPLSLVEGEAFIDIIEYACPGFKCPSRSWFTKQLEKAYQHALEDLKKDLKKRSSKITLTTDAWTSIATEAYLGVTCHYINDNWEMVSFVLCTKPLEDDTLQKTLLAGLKRLPRSLTSLSLMMSWRLSTIMQLMWSKPLESLKRGMALPHFDVLAIPSS